MVDVSNFYGILRTLHEELKKNGLVSIYKKEESCFCGIFFVTETNENDYFSKICEDLIDFFYVNFYDNIWFEYGDIKKLEQDHFPRQNNYELIEI